MPMAPTATLDLRQGATRNHINAAKYGLFWLLKRNVDPRALALDDDVTRQAAEPQSLAQQPDEPDGDQDQADDDQHLRHLRYLMRIAGSPADAPTTRCVRPLSSTRETRDGSP